MYADLTGHRFGRWNVLGRVWRLNTPGTYWLCRCDCGTLRVVRGSSLTKGISNSCGCLRNERVFMRNSHHNQCGSRIYRAWQNMKSSCQNPNFPNYIYNGANGVVICNEWQEFEPFYEWSMMNGYSDKLVLDRINKLKGYSPDNCLWVSYKSHCNNCSYNNYLSYNGDVHTLTEWSELLGIPRNTLSMRLNKYGWSIERALTTKVREVRKYVRKK